jgi:hypothetical protein
MSTKMQQAISAIKAGDKEVGTVDPNFESRVAKARDWCNLMSIKSKPKENADAPHD